MSELLNDAAQRAQRYLLGIGERSVAPSPAALAGLAAFERELPAQSCSPADGLWAAASREHASLTRGVGQADSWAADAHKWLNVPYDSGLVLVRDAAALRAAMSVEAAYLVQSGDRVPYQYTPDFSRRTRGVEVWAALRQLGRSGLAEFIDRTCRFAQRLAEGLTRAGHRVLNEVVLNQVLVTFGSAERTGAIIERIQRDGTRWCGGTVWQGHTAMRVSISSWATTDADVERSLEAILRAAETMPR